MYIIYTFIYMHMCVCVYIYIYRQRRSTWRVSEGREARLDLELARREVHVRQPRGVSVLSSHSN